MFIWTFLAGSQHVPHRISLRYTIFSLFFRLPSFVCYALSLSASQLPSLSSAFFLFLILMHQVRFLSFTTYNIISYHLSHASKSFYINANSESLRHLLICLSFCPFFHSSSVNSLCELSRSAWPPFFFSICFFLCTALLGRASTIHASFVDLTEG